jgi:hypothetical protein
MEPINGFVVLIFPESQNWWFFDIEIVYFDNKIKNLWFQFFEVLWVFLKLSN